MKRLLFALAIFLLSAGYSDAYEKQVIKLGLLTKLNTTETEFSEIWHKTFAPRKGDFEIVVRFYDSLTAMQMALNAGEIHEIVLPEAAAEYLLNQNPEYEATLVMRTKGMGLSFGFRADSKNLAEKFNEALTSLKSDWTLGALEGVYIALPGVVEPKPVAFEKFDGAETIKVAVTGDLPPMDLIAADGTPAGFNTAVLAEVGRYLKMNIELVNIEAGARTATLASGRTDVVFWYEVDTSLKEQPDVPEGVILSEPYYEWNKFVHIRKIPQRPKGRAAGWDIFDIRKNILDLYRVR